MIIEGEYQLPCKVAEAWRALNDPETLKLCITGCESIELTEENRFECLITAKYGPVKTRFKTVLNVTNINETLFVYADRRRKRRCCRFRQG